MLKPLTREKFEQLIPLIATSAQYAHYWGEWKDLLNRLLISVVALVVVFLVGLAVGGAAQGFVLLISIIVGLYWLWGPAYWASLRNRTIRRFRYSGFWQGRVLDVFATEELVSEEESFNQQGELIIVENRERRINLIIGDQTGFEMTVQAPLQRLHQTIKPGQIAELLVMSHRSDLSTIDKVSDVYLPSQNLWVGKYPWLQRDVFVEVSRELGNHRRSRYSRY